MEKLKPVCSQGARMVVGAAVASSDLSDRAGEMVTIGDFR